MSVTVLAILASLVKVDCQKLDISKFKPVSDSELETAIKEIIKNNKGAQFGALMGMAMLKFKGRAEGQKIAEIIKRNI